MKLNDLKHNHSLTDLLKVIIFSILMLMPFLAIATRCLYVVCNKNAYQSYSKEVIQQTLLLQNTSSLVGNVEYTLTYQDKGQTNQSPKIYYTQINIDWTNQGFPQHNYVAFQFNANYAYLYYDDGSGEVGYSTYNPGTSLVNLSPIVFTARGNNNSANMSSYNSNLYTYIFATDTLDNVFEYSLDQVTQSNLFNWTQNTGIYTGINTMTTQLGIVGVFIPMLLTYWFLLTVIYIIIDIVLKTFTVISHMLIKKAE